jgi:hypothetical protein
MRNEKDVETALVELAVLRLMIDGLCALFCDPDCGQKECVNYQFNRVEQGLQHIQKTGNNF